MLYTSGYLLHGNGSWEKMQEIVDKKALHRFQDTKIISKAITDHPTEQQMMIYRK